MVHLKLNSFLLLSYGKRLVTHEEPPCGSGCDEPEIEPTQLPNFGPEVTLLLGGVDKSVCLTM